MTYYYLIESSNVDLSCSDWSMNENMKETINNKKIVSNIVNAVDKFLNKSCYIQYYDIPNVKLLLHSMIGFKIPKYIKLNIISITYDKYLFLCDGEFDGDDHNIFFNDIPDDENSENVDDENSENVDDDDD